MSSDTSAPAAPASSGPSDPPPHSPIQPGAGSISEALHEYVDKVRGGDIGSLPAVLGLVVLVVIFSVLQPKNFADAGNFANLLTQATGTIVIAMGLIFVLLLGEIDLAAGYTAGTSAAVLGIVLTNHHWPWPLAVVACLVTGAIIGVLIGMLVALLKIPSFVVTLAFFLGLQGVLLLIIGDAGTIVIHDSTIQALTTGHLSVVGSWIFYLVVVGLYGLVTLWAILGRRRAGLPTPAMSVWVAKMVAMLIVLGVPTYYLCQDRGANGVVIRGIPYVVPMVLVLLVVLTFLLQRTALGRHIYAVGGNAEAARRAGINVPGIKVFCFVMCGMLAATAGIVLASRTFSVSPNTGGSTTLLYAVGAAVIGGTSLFGGRGKIKDAVLGGLVIATIDNGISYITQTAGVVFVVTALVLLLAASVDALSRRRAVASGRA
jgi:D-xylose transport system permease protein